jgi:diguanylate cyclase (GGDEF)-like protein/PAS domain S-box-containing protein
VNQEKVIQCHIRSISDRKEVENALKESEKRFSDIAENALEWIWEVDLSGRYTFSSCAVEKILGYKEDEVLGAYFYDFFHPEDREISKKAAFEAFSREEPFREFLTRNIHKSGKTVWLLMSGVPLLDDKGNLLGYRGADADVTELQKTAQELRDNEEVFRSITESALDAIIVADGSGNIRFWNRAAETLFGYSSDEAVGKPLTIIIPERFRRAHEKGMEQVVSGGKSKIMGRNYEITAMRKDGSEFPVEISLANWERKGGIFFTGIIRDITVRKQLEEKLRTVSITDELTGLLNRRGFLTLAQKHFEIARRNRMSFSILYLDLNEMKKINDEFGHREGDQALVDLSDILRKTFRASDIIARLGGDEFTVLITDTSGPGVERTITRHIEDSLRIQQTGRRYKLSVSMGMVHYNPEQPCSLEELLNRADELMYEHKQLKKESIPSSMGEKREERRHERYKTEKGPLAELVVSGSAVIKDISLGGISLRTSQRLTKNAVYGIRMHPHNDDVFSTKGLVVWSSVGGEASERDDAEPYYEAGLRFIEMDEGLKSCLERLVIGLPG